MAKSRKVLILDERRRLTLGTLARHEMYVGTVSPEGVITLDPRVLAPAGPAKPPRKRAPRKKAAPAADETLKETECQPPSESVGADAAK